MNPRNTVMCNHLLLLAAMAAACLTPVCAAPLPRPEHPMPQVVRAEWASLNGEWEFAETDDRSEDEYLSGRPYPDRINVPFCRESVLSGLGRTAYVENVWYRRSFDRPIGWKSSRVMLHFGASDWRTTVWLNGIRLGTHTGGCAPFDFDVTTLLKAEKNTIVVHAFDDARSGLQALGKQTTNVSEGCVYTRTTGIWQTVWLEGVGSTYVRDSHVESDPANSRVIIQSEIDGPSDGLTLKAVAYAEGKIVGTAEGPADWRNTKLVLNLAKKRLWSVEDPFLYDMKLTLMRGQDVVDSVDSYFGLRDVSISGTAILINGKPVFQRLILDQGFYPDGIWTAPNDEALKRDIELSKAAGFNGARFHEKVFDPRSLYWADKLGYLVWGEYPDWGMSHSDGRAVLPMIKEWVEVVRRDRNHPSIVGWCPFNETGHEAGDLQDTVVELMRTLDPSRPVIDTSGFKHSVVDPEVLDCHDYDQNPNTFRTRYNRAFSAEMALPLRYGLISARGIPFMVSEYGGIRYGTEGWGYGASPKNLDEFYARYAGLTNALLDNPAMFGFTYTQLTDVEQECNGLYTYDRKPKFDMKRIRTITARPAACEKEPLSIPDVNAITWRLLVGAFPDRDAAKEWRYTVSEPSKDWAGTSFDDSSWQRGLGGFGSTRKWEWVTRTAWNTGDIWLRQQFAHDGKPFTHAMLVLIHDDEAEVYVNGALILPADGCNDAYEGFDVTKAVQAALKPGSNTIAIHCHQASGPQFIDAALLVGSRAR